MQTQIFRRAVLGLMALGLTLGMLTILSCSGDDDDEDAIELAGELAGCQRSPPCAWRGELARQWHSRTDHQ